MQKEYYNNWEQMIIELKEHIHRKRMQVATYNSCKEDLKQNQTILHVDYRKSHKSKQHDEIQSAYL